MVVSIGAITVIELVIPYWINSDNCGSRLIRYVQDEKKNSDWAMQTRNSVKLNCILKLLLSNRWNPVKVLKCDR